MSTRPHTDLAAAPVGGDGEPAATAPVVIVAFAVRDAIRSRRQR